MKSFKEKIKLKEIIVDAEKGNAESQAYLACSYFEGKFGEKNNRKACYWAQLYHQNDSICIQYDDYIHYILGKFKFEGKYLDYDLDGARQLLEKSYSNGLIKAGLYLCEFVYPKYPSSLNYGEKRLKMLNDISQNSNIKVSNYAKFLLQNCSSTTI